MGGLSKTGFVLSSVSVGVVFLMIGEGKINCVEKLKQPLHTDATSSIGKASVRNKNFND